MMTEVQGEVSGNRERTLSGCSSVSGDGGMSPCSSRTHMGDSNNNNLPIAGGAESGVGMDLSLNNSLTPTRRNKRKMTAPKRRSDFSIKRFCPDSRNVPNSTSGDLDLSSEDDSGVEEEEEENTDFLKHRRKGAPGGVTTAVIGRVQSGISSALNIPNPRTGSRTGSTGSSPNGSSPESLNLSRPCSVMNSPNSERDIIADFHRQSSSATPHHRSHNHRRNQTDSGENADLIPSPTTQSAHYMGTNQASSSSGRQANLSEEFSHQQQQQQQAAVHAGLALQHPAFALSRHIAMAATGNAATGSAPHIVPVLPGQLTAMSPQGLLTTVPHLQIAGISAPTGGAAIAYPPPASSAGSNSAPRPGSTTPTTPIDFHSGQNHPMGPPSPTDSTSSRADGSTCSGSKKTRKNYKNMTRERRVEANARERSRVHTISAAFDALRRAVPSYSYNQKLSKLAILRIAGSYILSLAKLADLDMGEENSEYSFADCVDMCTSVIQTEGRARRRH